MRRDAAPPPAAGREAGGGIAGTHAAPLGGTGDTAPAPYGRADEGPMRSDGREPEFHGRRHRDGRRTTLESRRSPRGGNRTVSDGAAVEVTNGSATPVSGSRRVTPAMMMMMMMKAWSPSKQVRPLARSLSNGWVHSRAICRHGPVGKRNAAMTVVTPRRPSSPGADGRSVRGRRDGDPGGAVEPMSAMLDVDTPYDWAG